MNIYNTFPHVKGILSRALMRVGALALIAFIALVVAGCGRTEPPPEPVTLAFAFDRADEAHYARLATAFQEEHPHITLELRPRNWDMVSGAPQADDDVFITSQFVLPQLLAQGQILELSAFAEQSDGFDWSDFYPGAVDMMRSGGAVWGVPARIDLMLMYYNQDLFDARGAAYPSVGWTWEDFLMTALLLRDPMQDIYGYRPNYDGDMGLADAVLLPYQHGGRVFDDLTNPTQATFDDPLTIEALAWHASLIHTYDVAPAPELAQRMYADYPYLHSGIRQGQFGLWMGMLSERGGEAWGEPWPMRWGAVTLPQDQQMFTLALLESYFISAQTAHPEAAWTWVTYLSEAMPNRRAPVQMALVNSEEFARTVGEEVVEATRASLDNMQLISPQLVGFGDALGIYAEAYGEILAGRADAVTALSRAQQRAR